MPFEYLPRYLGRTLNAVAGAEDYDGWESERRDEDRVVGVMDTGFGREVRARIVDAYVQLTFKPSDGLSPLLLLHFRCWSVGALLDQIESDRIRLVSWRCFLMFSSHNSVMNITSS